MQQKTLTLDPRYFQILFQLIFLSYGIFALSWSADVQHYLLSIGGCLFFNYAFESAKQNRLLKLTGSHGFKLWGFSVLISAASLCLLLKTNNWSVSLLAAFLTVASKYFLRIGHKHIFNPSAFGIIATIVLTKDAWLSPGQWGSTAVLFFAIATLGTIVVTRVQKLDVSLAFLFTFIGLLYWRQVYVLGWPMDHFVHSISTGGLLLFTFFMISDPRTSPNHPAARIIWAVMIAGVSFYLTAFKFMNSTPIWVLVMAAPLVPVFDAVFKAKSFGWQATPLSFAGLSIFKKLTRPMTGKIAASVLLAAMITHEAAAFCGFYVSKADGTLKNKTSQVIMVRDGDKNVITMYNDFKGNFKDFAMVVPVPVVLAKKDIKVVNQQIFQTLNEYSQPRLVEYFDENPCDMRKYDMTMNEQAVKSAPASSFKQRRSDAEDKVKIEAQYIVGEYDILILSATESTALKAWLDENGYKIPAGANEVLEPYIKSNLKFFVVKVNEAEKKKLPGDFLRPIQITFNSPKFMLPIRLGMANADGDQDMLVYAFTKKGRVEVTNYRTVSMPTGKSIPLFVKNNFSSFYSNLYQHQWKREGKSVAMLEYAWDVSPKNFMKCDPCVATAPAQQDLVQAGVWWMDPQQVADNSIYSSNVYFTRLHVRYNRQSFPQDLMFQLTPNTENFQSRYIVTHPATGDFNCAAGKQYLKDLKQRRSDELEMLNYLTGKGYANWDMSGDDGDAYVPADASYKNAAVKTGKTSGRETVLIASLGLLGLAAAVSLKRKREA